MRYKLNFANPKILLSVEDSFTLLDFLAFFACFFLGFVFAIFLWMFAFALLVKLFTRHEYEFDSDSYRLSQYIRIFGYLRIKRRVISFEDIDRFLFSNFDSGNALVERGLVTKEWYTLEIVMKDKRRIRMVKSAPDELHEIDELYHDLREYMSDWFHFEVDYEELKGE